MNLIKSISLFLLWSITTSISAQVETEVILQDVSINGSVVQFNIYLNTTDSSPGNLLLGEADFVMTFNDSVFSNPTFSKILGLKHVTNAFEMPSMKNNPRNS